VSQSNPPKTSSRPSTYWRHHDPAKTSPSGGTTKIAAPKQPKSTNLPNKTKGAGNIIRPTNQQGTRTSPNIRRADDLSWLSVVENLLEKEYTVIETDDLVSDIPKDDDGLNN
jgi:hypothetical protein